MLHDNAMSPRFDGKIAEDIFEWIFFNENDISVKITVKVVLRIPINNKRILDQIKTCCWTDEEPSETTLDHDDIVHWRIYASLGFGELTAIMMFWDEHVLSDPRPHTRPSCNV